MHKSVVLFAALAASGLFAEAAWAKTWSITFVSQKDLAVACKKHAGGVSYSQSGGTYGCAGKNVVQCNSNTKTCTASDKTRTAPGTEIGVLTGTGVLVSTGAKPPKGNHVLGAGMLEGGGVLGTQGPAAAGTPVRPSRHPHRL